MAVVIALFSYVILLHVGQMLGPYMLIITKADGIALDIYVGRCYCQCHVYCYTRYADYSGKADVVA